MDVEFDKNEKTLVERVRMHIHFYRRISGKVPRFGCKGGRTVGTVKRNIFDPPEFIIEADIQEKTDADSR